MTKLNWSKVTKRENMVSSLPSLCRLQAILTLLLTIIACQVTKIFLNQSFGFCNFLGGKLLPARWSTFSWINPLDFCNFLGGQTIACQVTNIFLNNFFGFFKILFWQSIACQVNKILRNQSFGFFANFFSLDIHCLSDQKKSDNILAFLAIIWPFVCQF